MHNGIITNYKELKALLESKGEVFESETDTECIAKLVSQGGNHIPVGMAVDSGGGSVGSPSRVSDSSVRNKRSIKINAALLDQLLQLDNLANLLESVDLVLLITVNGNTGGIIATVFESRETYRGQSATGGLSFAARLSVQRLVYAPFTKVSKMNLRSFSTR